MLTSFLNDDYADQNAADQELIRAYIDAKGLDLEYDPISGIHYRIISIGDTTYRPSADSSDILVNYEGRLLNDTIFVKGDSVEMDLAREPIGFQLGVSSIGEGGKIFMVVRSEEHTSELQSLMRISYAVFCLKKKKQTQYRTITKQRPSPEQK